MGNSCSAQEQKVEEKAEELVEQVKEMVEGAPEKAEEVAEEAKELAEEDKAKVEKAAEGAAETAADAAATVQAEAEQKVEEVKEGAAEVAAEVKEAAAEGAEAAQDTMAAAVAAVTGSMLVEFDMGKGATKTLDFKTKALGFTCDKAGAGCCASKPSPKVVVCKVEKNQQADKLGVKHGWAVLAVSGTRVSGAEEAKRLLQEGAGKLPEA